MAAPNAHASKEVTIAAGTAVSTAANISPRGTESSLVGIIVPSTFDGTSLTFEASNDGTNFFDLYAADGTPYAVQAGADRWVALDPADFAGVGWVRLTSSTTQATTDTVLTLVYRSLA